MRCAVASSYVYVPLSVLSSICSEHVVHAAGVAAGAQPLDALETVTGAAIVVGQRTEGGDCGTAQHELSLPAKV